MYILDQDDKEKVFTYSELEEYVSCLKENVIQKSYEDGSNGFIDFTSNGEFVTIDLQSTAEIRFKIVE